MKTLKNLALLGSLILLLFSCKTAQLQETHTLYPNKVIDSSLSDAPAYVKEIEPYKKRIDSIMDSPVTYAKEDFTKTGYSSNEGNLLADLTLDFAKKYAQQNKITEPEFCLLNIGGVRTIIPKGTVTVGTIFEVSPFENELVFVRLNGSQMNQMFEYLVKEKKGHPLAGAKIVYKNNRLYSAEIGGKPFDPAKNYWVVTIDYLMNGGDRMDFFTQSDQTVVLGVKLRDMLIEQMGKYIVLPDSPGERLIFTN